MSDCPMLISNKLHSFRNFIIQSANFIGSHLADEYNILQTEVLVGIYRPKGFLGLLKFFIYMSCLQI